MVFAALLQTGCLQSTFNAEPLDGEEVEEDAPDSVLDTGSDIKKPDIKVTDIKDTIVPDVEDVEDIADVQPEDVAIDALEEVAPPDVASDTAVAEIAPEDVPDIQMDSGPPDVPPSGSPLGSVCVVDGDCQSKTCVDTGAGLKTCTTTCTGNCPDGFRCSIAPSSGSTTLQYCLKLPGDLCKPCTVDDQCKGGACITIESTKQQLCGVPCGTKGECPTGFDCQSFIKKGEMCVPHFGTCQCDDFVDGNDWACSLTTNKDTCFGTQSCNSGAWTLCNAKLPTPELCDTLDNNCNGLTDEAFAKLGQACGVGVCANGKYTCSGDKLKEICSTDVLKAKKETCDGVDNDCNGVTDEGCKPKDVDGDGVADINDCKPYLPEYFPGAKEPCCKLLPTDDAKTLLPASPTTSGCDFNCDGKIYGCDSLDLDGDGVAKPDDCNDKNAKIFPGAKDKCGDGVDQDCDGADAVCTKDNDEDGDGYNIKYDCEDGSAAVYPGAPEVCNKIDDDCDGVVDNGDPGGGAACGLDNGACKPGTMVCNHVGLVAAVTCTDAQGGTTEICNGKDDDCNGKTDETFLTLGTSCDGEDDDKCPNGKNVCGADGISVICGPESVYDVQEVCKAPGQGNDVDENCNGFTDETCAGDDVDGDGFIAPKDCNVLDAGFNPNAKEGCCDPNLGDGDAAKAVCDYNCDAIIKSCDPADKDFDGFIGDDDCNPADAKIHVGAPEKCGDDIDQDCDGQDLKCETIVGSDQDSDGFADGQDCKKFDPKINPLAEEICNGKDDDCDGLTDEGNPGGGQVCGSTEGECKAGTTVCAHFLTKDGVAKALVQCVAKVAAVAELCNAVDDNCNGKTDEYFTKLGKACDGNDSDKCANGTWSCSDDGKTEACVNESIQDIAELCDGADNNCDGLTDENMTYFGKKLGEKCKGLGACGDGVVVCSPELQVAACSSDAYGTDSKATPELCDGIDNDCDGFTDEGLLFDGHKVGEPCKGAGECGKTPGVVECAADASGAVCSTSAGGSKSKAKPEKCNGLDDNCDGHVDEALGAGDSDCKQTGLCNLDNVKAACKAGKWKCDYTAVAGYQSPTEVQCDGLDNNCDGKTDEVFQVGESCDGPDNDLCKNGKMVCGVDKLTSECSAESVTDIIEACNGVDDNCNDKTDEDFPVGLTCDGPDSDLCKNGVWTCAKDGTQAECVNETKKNLVEICNDIDDDCNGQVDENYNGLGLPCDGTDTDKCLNGLIVCNEAGNGTICGPETASNIVEVCDGVDNDCNGKIDEGQLYQGKALGAGCTGINGCGAGTVVCSPNDKVATCSTNPNAYLIFDGKELCDGIDNDCNGKTDDNLSWKDITLGLPCPGVGECKAGKVECATDKQVTCSTLANGSKPQSKAEICDGKDNDCNGATDENLTVKESTCLKVGVCGSDKLIAKCDAVLGVWVCDYGDIAGFQGIETLCDGLDNDCDGLTDEGFDVGKTCDGDDSDLCKLGTWTCTADGAKHECVNEALTNLTEVCNGKDDNCDGKIDEGFDYNGQNLGVACKGNGVCGPGTVVCGSNGLATCSTNGDGPASQAKPEVCDNFDNDCNGKTDDTLKYNGLPVGAPCSGAGECGLGAVVCGALKTAVCSTNPDGPASLAKAEICDGKDNDCNGATDDAIDVKKSSCNQVGVCAFALTAQCTKGVWKCGYANFGFEPKETLCDDKDNDCNGITDDGYLTKGKPCDGPDVDSCKNGQNICSATQKGVECSEPPNAGPTAEVCDGKDNDCNGLTDETFAQLGQACDGPDSDQCPNGSYTCTADGVGVECVNEFIKNLQEICDGKDNNCNNQIDEGLSLGELCDGPDSDKCKSGVFICDGGGKVICGPESKPNSPEVCNNKDDDCDGVIDNGFEQKGLKCGFPCSTGSYQCSAQFTLACSNQYDCVAGAICKQGKNASELDQCLCGLSTCSIAQGDACNNGTCTCKGGAACAIGNVCSATGCK